MTHLALNLQSPEDDEKVLAEANMALVKGIKISEDKPADIDALNSVTVYAEVKCPRCSIQLATYTRIVESNQARIGGTVSVSFTGSCYNRGFPGSGAFDWSGTVTSAYIYEIP